LAGDSTHFNSTLVGLNADADIGNIVAIGFYGDHIKIQHGSQGGWECLDRKEPSPVRPEMFCMK
jgi:hypothetical protein